MTESSPGAQRTVYEDVLGRIQRGELCPGDQVPSERALEAQHGVARLTARRALEALAAEGKITTLPGKRGRYVREYQALEWRLSEFERGPRLDSPEEGRDDWAARVAAAGREPRQETSVWQGTVEQAEDDRVGDWLQLPADARVIERRRIRLVDGVPWQLSSSWFPRWLADEEGGHLLLADHDVVVPGGILRYIGQPQVGWKDRIVPRLPTDGEIRALRLPPRGTAVAEHVRIGLAADRRPIRVMKTIAPGDRHVLIYEMDA